MPPANKKKMFYFDYWTAISTLIQVEFIHELAPRSLWLIVFRTQNAGMWRESSGPEEANFVSRNIGL